MNVTLSSACVPGDTFGSFIFRYVGQRLIIGLRTKTLGYVMMTLRPYSGFDYNMKGLAYSYNSGKPEICNYKTQGLN